MKKHETLGTWRLNSLGGAGPGEVNQDDRFRLTGRVLEEGRCALELKVWSGERQAEAGQNVQKAAVSGRKSGGNHEG